MSPQYHTVWLHPGQNWHRNWSQKPAVHGGQERLIQGTTATGFGITGKLFSPSIFLVFKLTIETLICSIYCLHELSVWNLLRWSHSWPTASSWFQVHRTLILLTWLRPTPFYKYCLILSRYYRHLVIIWLTTNNKMLNFINKWNLVFYD